MKLKGNYIGKPKTSCATIDEPTGERIRFTYEGVEYERAIYERITWRNMAPATVQHRFVIVNGDYITLDELEEIETPKFTPKLGISTFYDGYQINLGEHKIQFRNPWEAEDYLVERKLDLEGITYDIAEWPDGTWLIIKF